MKCKNCGNLIGNDGVWQHIIGETPIWAIRNYENGCTNPEPSEVGR